ncbi:unnamed protein product, partial [Rotaria magnacalcarata]
SFSAKLNVEPSQISNVSNPSSPQTNRQVSQTPPSASTLFANPFQGQQIESNPSLKEETQTNKDIAIGTLLDITGDDTHHP